MKCSRQLGLLFLVLFLHVQVVVCKYQVTYTIHVPVADVMANGRTVFVHFEESRSWNEASEICRQRFLNEAGSLAKIDSQEAHEVITTLLNQAGDPWFGLYNEGKDGKRHLMWSDVRCTDFEFGNFARFKQLDDENSHPQEPCYYLSDKGTLWNNDKCSTSRSFVCEYQELNNSSCEVAQGEGGTVAGEAPYKEVKARFFYLGVANVSLQACSRECTKRIGCFLTSLSPSQSECLMGVVSESASSLVKASCVTGIKMGSLATSFTSNNSNFPNTCVQTNTSGVTGNTSSGYYGTTTKAPACVCPSVTTTSTVLTTHTSTVLTTHTRTVLPTTTQFYTITVTTIITSTSPAIQFPSSCVQPRHELSTPREKETPPASFHETIQTSIALTTIATSFLEAPSSAGPYSIDSPVVRETSKENVHSGYNPVVQRTSSANPYSKPYPIVPATSSTNPHSNSDPVVPATSWTNPHPNSDPIVPATSWTNPHSNFDPVVPATSWTNPHSNSDPIVPATSWTNPHSNSDPIVPATSWTNPHSNSDPIVPATSWTNPHTNSNPVVPATSWTNPHSNSDPVETRTSSTDSSSSASLVEAVKATSSPCPGCTCPASQLQGVETDTVTRFMLSFTEITVTVTNCRLTTSKPVIITSFLPLMSSLTTTASYQELTDTGGRITAHQLKPTTNLELKTQHLRLTTHIELKTQQLKPTTHLELKTQHLRPTTHTDMTSRLQTWTPRPPGTEMLTNSHTHLNYRLSHLITQPAVGSPTDLPGIDNMRSAIIRELLLNDRQLSKSRRTRESAPDQRLSAQVSGSLAMLILIAVLSCLLIIDLPRMLACIKDTFVTLKT